jgi:hypothetical protein
MMLCLTSLSLRLDLLLISVLCCYLLRVQEIAVFSELV